VDKDNLKEPINRLIQAARRRARVLNHGYERIASRLPANVAAHVDRLHPRYSRSWGGPFNGQRLRQQVFEELVRVLSFAAIVETGTHRGTTTEYMHRASGLPVYTVEVGTRYFLYARRRLRRYHNVSVEEGDSRTFLKALSREHIELLDRPVLFYLDAHWYEDLPLRDELDIITGAWRLPIVLIDDFQVADDPGYGYDDYGAGRRLSLDYLAQFTVDTFEVFAPSASSVEETGYRRGYALLAPPSLADNVRRIRGLRTMPNLPTLRS
jgi:hypothetical protein